MYKNKFIIIAVLLLLELVVIYLISNPPLGIKEMKKIADSAAKTGKIGRAVRFYGYALEKEPNNAELYYKRAVVFEKNGMNGNAESDLDEAVEIEPNNVKYRVEQLKILDRYYGTSEVKAIMKLNLKEESDFVIILENFRKFNYSENGNSVVLNIGLDEKYIGGKPIFNNQLIEKMKTEEMILSVFQKQFPNSKLLKEKKGMFEIEKLKYEFGVDSIWIEENKKENIKNRMYLLAEKYKGNFKIYEKIEEFFQENYPKILDENSTQEYEYIKFREKIQDKYPNYKKKDKLIHGYGQFIKDITEQPYKYYVYEDRGEYYIERKNYWYALMDIITAYVVKVANKKY